MAHDHDDRMDTTIEAEVEDGEYLPDACSSRLGAPLGRGPVLEASAQDQGYPIADRAERRRQQPDTAGGGHLVGQEGAAG